MLVSMNKNRNPMLDFIKGIACICVVFIHVTFPDRFGLILKNICGYAVPLFFVIAGYYAGGGTRTSC